MKRYPINGIPVISQGYYVGKYASHKGEDLAVVNKTAVVAQTAGIVVQVKNNETRNWLANTESDPFKPFGFPIRKRRLKDEDYGNYIKIDHGSSIHTLQGHLDSVVAYEGQVVKKGQLVAYSDNTGNSTGPHIHSEVRVNNIVVNPNTFDYSFEGNLSPDLTNEFFPYIGTVTVRPDVDILYVRSGPARSFSLSGSGSGGNGKLNGGDEVPVRGFVRGERLSYGKVETQFWWVSTKGNYFWSGGTDLIPTLDNYPEGIIDKEKEKEHMQEKMQLIEDLKAREAELEVFFAEALPLKEKELADVQGELVRLEAEVAAVEAAEPTPEEVVEEAVEEVKVEEPAVEAEVIPEEVTEIVEEPVVEAEVVDEDKALFEKFKAFLSNFKSEE